MKKQKWWSQKILFMTEIVGKKYFWMEDVDGHIYIAKAVKHEGLDQWEPELL